MSSDTFAGKIGPWVKDSVPDWPVPTRPTDGSPNIVMFVLDDVGFAHLGCYGSTIATPTMDRLAAGGVRFSSFHVTALCSSTRASLLTGRNHHAVGMATVANWDTGFPSGRGRITPAAATIAEILQAAGYNTYAVGKWHLTPGEESTAVGPYRDWPLGRGFDRFYGFLGGWTNHWAPQLWHDNHRIPSPPGADYHLTEDLAGQAIGYLRDHLCADPDKPFFLYLAAGACHAPLHAPARSIAKYRGAFDLGWDRYRADTLERQKGLGVVPAEAVLAPRNPGVPAWAELSSTARREYARWNEVFAGFLDHTDEQLGRLVQYLEERDLLAETLFLVLSDNGASSEGGPDGTPNYLYGRGGAQARVETQSDVPAEALGGPDALGIYPQGWAQAGNTPLKWYKTYTYGGGVRAPLIVHWPQRLTDKGDVRTDFLHVTDVMPTVLEAAHLDAPAELKGVEQMPVHGTSFMETLLGSQNRPILEHRSQYFETFGHRGIWHDGWKAVTLHEPGGDYQTEKWEMYHLDSDFSECNDMAAEHPELLDAMIALWWGEAERNGVLPLDDRRGGLGSIIPPYSVRRRSTFSFEPLAASIPSGVAPDVVNRSYEISATIESFGEGVLLAHGGRFGGYSFFIQNGHATFVYNNGAAEQLLRSDRPIDTGAASLTFRFTKTGEFEGIGEIIVDNALVAKDSFTDTLRTLSMGFEGLECGRDELTPVSRLYQPPFWYTGRIRRVMVQLMADGFTRGADRWHGEVTEQ